MRRRIPAALGAALLTSLTLAAPLSARDTDPQVPSGEPPGTTEGPALPTGKEVAESVRRTAREVGRGAKKAAEEVGKAVRDLGKRLTE